MIILRQKVLIIFSVLLFGAAVFFPSLSLAYSIATHAYLTKEAFSFYNERFADKKIPDELLDYLVDGARREDDVPRWMNHFYDPVKERGLSYDPAINPGINLGNWQKSKEWAVDSENQNKLTYKVPVTVASILTAFQRLKISAITSETNYTWQEAIRYYVNGELEKAMFTLGHILHLVEDASVPDHTRNDPHPNDSPYEDFARKFTLTSSDEKLAERLKNKNVVLLSNLESYFNELAKYSNNNFYSKDTIGIQSGFSLPEPDYSETLEDGRNYWMHVDKEFGIFPLIQTKGLLSLKNDELLNRSLIMSAYWSRLSTKAVQHAAGVINLFFQEVEKAKNDPNFVKEKPKSFFATLIDMAYGGVKNVVGFVQEVFRKDVTESEVVNLGSEKSQTVAQLDGEDENDYEDDESVENFESDTARNGEQGKVLGASVAAQDVLQSVVDSAATKTAAQNTITQNTMAQNKIALVSQSTTSSVATSTPAIATSTTTATTTVNSDTEADEDDDDSGEPTTIWPSGGGSSVTQTKPPPQFFPVIINEIMYDVPGSDDGNEWIEILNTGTTTVDMSDWKFYEGGTNHRLSVALGSQNLSPGGYAIIADDSGKFLVSYSNFSGTIFDSSFSLSNSGEILILKNQDLVIDTVAYSSSTGARGDEKSLQLVNGIWVAAMPTPGAVNTSQQAENQLPLASFSFSPNSPRLGDIVTFDAASSSDPDGSVQFFEWMFGDNTSSTATSSITTHAYSSIGNYTVRLVVFDNRGASSTAEKQISVEETPNQPPSAEFDFTSGDLYENDEVIFTAASSTDADGFITSYLWNFSDGTVVSQASSSISHSFSTSSSFSVSLTVFDNDGASSTTSRAVYIKSKKANHIVISEILFDAEGSDEGKEFIELYNPTESSLNLSGWSLRYSVGDATTTNSLASFGASADDITNIQERGFLLVGLNNYNSANFNGRAADVKRSASLQNGGSEARVILYSSDDIEVDRISYTSSSISIAGQSLERKAFFSAACVSPAGDGEFLGNACDTNAQLDFVIRDVPKPQNSQNLKEPRGQLSSPSPRDGATSTVFFSSSTVTLAFAWQVSTSSDQTGIVTYRVIDKSVNSTTLPMYETTSTEFSVSIDEVGRNYTFEMQAFDEENFDSATSTYEIFVPSFLNNLYFYRDTRQQSISRYLVDLYYGKLPFIPPIFNKNTWQAVVFYLNREPDKNNTGLTTAGSHWPENKDGVLVIVYPSCVGGASNDPKYSITFPLASEWCGIGGGLHNSTLQFSSLEDNHLLITVASTTSDIGFSTDDYVTIAYYDFSYSGGGTQNFSLVAVDVKKYFFLGDKPEQQAPILVGDLSVSFDEPNSQINLLWNAATDPDTLDLLVRYELNFSSSSLGALDNSLWLSSTTLTSFAKLVSPGDSFIIGFRAVDDFGNISSVATSSWTYPETVFSILQESTNNWSAQWGGKSESQPSYPDTASLQSVIFGSATQFNKAVLRIWQDQYTGYGPATIRLSVYGDDGVGRPNFDVSIGSASLGGINNPPQGQEITFSFSPAITLSAGVRYWFVLDVAGYSSNKGFFSNSFKNAINVGLDVYTSGQSGKGAGGVCPNPDYCGTTIPFPDGTADWYMKIGLRE